MKKFLTSALATSVATVTLVTMLATSAASAAPLSFQTILLLNGWKTYSPTVRAAKVAIDADNIVHLLGAIKSGSEAQAFTLDPQFRPNKIVYLHTNVFNGAGGRLEIDPDGKVYISGTTSFAAAQNFTSLEGLTFAK